MALLTLAVRNLRRNRRRSAITLAALVLGTTAMMGAKGFINGIQRMFLDNVVSGQVGALQVHRTGYLANVLSSPLTIDMADSPELRAKLRSAPHVKAVAPRIVFGAMMSMPDKKVAPEDGSELSDADKGKTTFLMATAIEPGVEANVTTRRSGLVSPGRMFVDSSSPEVVLNADFAIGLDARVHAAGEPLPPPEQMAALLAADRDAVLNGENVVLGGTYPSFAPGDRRNGLVPLQTAQRLLHMEGRVTEYALAVEPLEKVHETKAALQAALGSDYEVHTWDEIFPFIKELMGTQGFIYGIVNVIFLVVVLVGIVNAMLMSVLERVREIGTMLAVGMRRRSIVRLFVLEGFVLGAVGGLIGSALGVLLVLAMHAKGVPLAAPGATVDGIVRPFVSPGFVVLTVLEATVGCTLAALWPALRASALRPVEALSAP